MSEARRRLARDALETATKRIIAEKSRVAERARSDAATRAALGAERVAKDARAVVAEAWLADALVAWDADVAENVAARAALAARVDELRPLNAKASRGRASSATGTTSGRRSPLPREQRSRQRPLPKSGAWVRGAGGGPRPRSRPAAGNSFADGRRGTDGWRYVMR